MANFLTPFRLLRRSHPVASVVDPEFDEEWLFPLQDPDRVTMAPIPSLLLISEKIEVAIYRETQMRARKPVTAEAWGTEKKVELLGTHKLEWRRVLVHGKEAITFEVKGENGDLASYNFMSKVSRFTEHCDLHRYPSWSFRL